MVAVKDVSFQIKPGEVYALLGPNGAGKSTIIKMIAGLIIPTSGSIRIGNKVNIQDGAIIHCTYQRAPTTIGNNVSIGHRAIVHGCTIHDNVLVGMGAMVMDHVVVESNVLIAAGAVVLENSHLESNCIYAGVPAKKVKELSPEKFADTIHRISDAYVMYASWFNESPEG